MFGGSATVMYKVQYCVMMNIKRVFRENNRHHLDSQAIIRASFCQQLVLGISYCIDFISLVCIFLLGWKGKKIERHKQMIKKIKSRDRFVLPHTRCRKPSDHV